MTAADPALRYLAALRRTQWLGPLALEAYQRPLLDRLLRHAATQTSYYPDRLAPLFNGGDPATAPIDLTRWHDVPILRRTHVIDHVDELRARDTPPDTGEAIPGSTSGSTGRALNYVRSKIARRAETCTLNRVYETFEMDLSGSLAFITGDRAKAHQYPQGAIRKGWSLTVPEAPLYALDVATPAVDKLEWLERMHPDHVLTYPTHLAEVAAIAKARKSALRFKTFIATGEPLSADHRDSISAAFGCRVIDLYSTREIGIIAFQCPVGHGYHVAAETVLCEIVDEAGLPARPGQYGRVVVTGFYNFAMPFIRYDIGDYAIRSRVPCACGRGLPALDQIGGRARNAFVLPDGSRKQLFGLIVRDVAKHLSYRQVQLVQTDVNTIEVRYVPHEDMRPADIDGLTRAFREQLHPAVNVQLVRVERFERGPGMKFEQFVSQLA